MGLQYIYWFGYYYYYDYAEGGNSNNCRYIVCKMPIEIRTGYERKSRSLMKWKIFFFYSFSIGIHVYIWIYYAAAMITESNRRRWQRHRYYNKLIDLFLLSLLMYVRHQFSLLSRSTKQRMVRREEKKTTNLNWIEKWKKKTETCEVWSSDQTHIDR